MVLVIKVELDPKNLLKDYPVLIAAQEKDSKMHFDELQLAVKDTIFKSVNSQKSSLPIFPSENRVEASTLMRSLIQPQLLQGQQFLDFVQDSKATKKEEKISTPNINTNPINFYDFNTNGVIDTTKFSLVNSLRENITTPRNSTTEIPSKPTRADTARLYTSLSKDYQVFLNGNSDYRKLNQLLQFNPNSPDIPKLAESINNNWVKGQFYDQLKEHSQKGTLFSFLSSDSATRSYFFQKSRILSISKYDQQKAPSSLILRFSQSEFTSKYFDAKCINNEIHIFIKSDIEKLFINQFTNAAATIVVNKGVEHLERAINSLSSSSKITTQGYLNNTINYVLPTGGSIPMSRTQLNFATIKATRSATTFVKTGEEENNVPAFSMGTFLSSENLRLLVIQKMVKDMPHGIPGGPPPPVPNILTYRTGVFANSLELLVNYKTRVVQYYYNPIYYVHERTSRDPRKLITSSIQSVLASRFKQAFRISEVYRF